MKMSSFANPNFIPAWNKVYAGKDLLPRLAYKTRILHDYLVTQNKKFLELRETILNKYAIKGEDGKVITNNGNVSFKDEDLDGVNKEFSELMSLELEPNVPVKMTLEELERDEVKLSGQDTALLADLIDFT